MLIWKIASRSLTISAAASSVTSSFALHSTTTSTLRFSKGNVSFLSTATTAFFPNRYGTISVPSSTLIGQTRAGIKHNMSSSNVDSTNQVGRVALLQFPVTEDKAKNIETAREFLLRAKKENAQLAGEIKTEVTIIHIFFREYKKEKEHAFPDQQIVCL